MPTILGANSVSGYEVSNSLRFNAADSAKLSFTQGTPTSRRTWTYSTWVKRGNLADQQESILSWGDEDFFDIRFQDGTPDDGLLVYISDGDSKTLATNRLFRDPSAWYHIVVASDTTDGTAGDRTRIYVNGVEETSFASEAQPDQNYDYRGLVSGDPIVIGNRYTGSHFFDGYLADTHFIDGQQLAPSNFGETNDNGVWIPKKYLGTYGTNGFKLEYKQTGTSANASGMGADTSGNGNHFSVTNLAATDITVDTPTNNFATMNPLDNYYQQYTYAEGNLKITTNADYYNWNTSTIGVTSGKWYVEAKATQVGTGSDNWVFGVAAHSPTNNNQGMGADNFSIAYRNNGNYKTGDSNNTHGAAFSEGDIVMIALDLDNDNVYFGSGGQWADGSGNTDEASPNSAVSLSNLRGSTTLGNTVFFGFGDWNSNAASTVSIAEINFGNPSYANSSGNADANGYGDFEYAPPSGYYALCTKNLAEYG